ncbi:CPBP family intramembrane glutamic endopeptidase [Staphylococcus simulans]|uniref:CPBP family intramembrane glutamic endopeptidase n=1 Tax=Staphylococcus simulans TaxID=1286 RepID=UPI00399AAFFB
MIENEQRQLTEAQSNPYQSNRVMKRDFWLIPLFFIAIPLITALVMFPLRLIYENQYGDLTKHTFILFNVMGSLAGQIVLLLIYYLMHRKYIIPIAKARFAKVKRYVWVLLLTYLAMSVAQAIYGGLMLLLPKHLQFDNTQNQLMALQLFDNPWAWPMLFLDIVILTPFIEELTFRHLIIHELGKKIGYTAGAIISVIVFAFVHVFNASSPFEFGVYAIMAGALVFVYMYSRRNLAVSIAFHMIVNGVGFIGIVGQFIMDKVS